MSIAQLSEQSAKTTTGQFPGTTPEKPAPDPTTTHSLEITKYPSDQVEHAAKATHLLFLSGRNGSVWEFDSL